MDWTPIQTGSQHEATVSTHILRIVFDDLALENDRVYFL
jgi:hypothetical protein